MTAPIALCLGGAAGVWADLDRARALIGGAPHQVVACNFAGITYPGHLDAWVTLHPEMFAPWGAARAAAGLNTDYRLIVHAPHPGLEAEVLEHGWYGSSGLYAAQVALQRLGASCAILCGVPLDESAGHIHWAGPWRDAGRYHRGFEAAKADGANIRSMSGWTAELLGAPDAAWLAAIGAPPPPPAADDLDVVVVREGVPMRIRLLADHDFTPPEERRITLSYREGGEYTVKRAWGARMVAAGAAVEIAAPRRAARADA